MNIEINISLPVDIALPWYVAGTLIKALHTNTIDYLFMQVIPKCKCDKLG